MADYIDQDVNGLLPGEPWTSAKAIATFENPVAIAEGAPGAPVIVQGWHGINQTVHGAGDASARIWNHATDGNLTSIEVDPITAGYEYMIRFSNLTAAGTGSVTFSVTLNDGTDWIAQPVASFELRKTVPVSGGDPGETQVFTYRRHGKILLPFLRASSVYFMGEVSGSATSKSGTTPPGLVNGSLVSFDSIMGFTRAAAMTPTKFRIQSNLASGALWVYKRRVGGL